MIIPVDTTICVHHSDPQLTRTSSVIIKSFPRVSYIPDLYPNVLLFLPRPPESHAGKTRVDHVSSHLVLLSAVRCQEDVNLDTAVWSKGGHSPWMIDMEGYAISFTVLRLDDVPVQLAPVHI